MKEYKAFKQFIFTPFIILFTGLFPLFNVLAQQPSGALVNSKDYVKIIKYYRYLNPDSALFYVQQGLKIADKQKDELGRAALLNQYGMIEDNATRYKESREKYLEAEAIYRKLKNDEGLATTLIRLGVVERRKGIYDKSLSYAIAALKISEKNNNKQGMLEGRIVVAEAFYFLNDYDNTLKNLQLAEKINSQIPISNTSLNMYIDFGELYNKRKEYKKAIEYIEKGLSLSNKIEYNGLKISLLRILGVVYASKGETQKAVAIFNEALTFSRQIRNVLREQFILVELGSVYQKSKPDTALFYLNQAYKIVTKYRMFKDQVIILNKMSSVYKQKGDLKQALFYREQSNALSEQVFYKDMLKQVSSLETAYDLEKSKVQLKELILKSNKQTMVKNIILSVAICIFIIFIVILIYYLRSKYLNSLLKKVNAELAESNNVKDKFFSIIAHDIRSPMVSTISILQLISDKELDEETQFEMVGKLMLHCNNSLEILDKLLKWGQMQIKGVRLNISEFNPMKNVENNLALLKQAAEKKEIKINVDISPAIVIQADTDHFDFIIRNLIANAIKFTNVNGEININAQDLGKNKVKFEVSDNGVGISKARIAKLFELNATGTKGTSAEEGTSLGLVICREFVLANNGDISVSSQVGKGTIFSFTMNGFLKNNA